MNFLAVGFLAGLRMTAPDMKHSLDVYYDEQNLMDVRILSTLGLTQDDIDALKEFDGGDFESENFLISPVNECHVYFLTQKNRRANIGTLFNALL